jgi:hypothetical protein
MPPTVLDGDSGEYQYMAYILGVPHSTGYPLYILLAKLFTLLPVGDVAYRVTLFSATFAALTVPLVYKVTRRLVSQRIPAVLTTAIFAVTPSVWGGAIDAEVYALHLFIGVLAIVLALGWHQTGHARAFYWLALVFGLGLAHHLIIVFIAPALALVVWFNRARLNRAMVTRGVLLTLLPLLLYAYIPIRASQLIAWQDPANWELYTREDAILKGTISAYYNHSLEGFIKFVTGFDNRSKLGFKSPLDEANRLNLTVTLLLEQFGLAGLGLAVAGAWASFRRDRKVFSILLAIAAGVGFIAVYLRGESTVYYFSLAYFALALWIGFGIDALLEWAAHVRRATEPTLRGAEGSPFISARASPRVVAAVLLLLPLSALIVNFPRLDKSNYNAARDFAQAVLNDHLAPNAVVIAPWEVSQPIRYYQFVENQRPDLLVVNVSPVWQQFQTMLARARALNRPFYLVEFSPELRTTPGPRSVQAIPLPLPDEPRPRYLLPNTHVIPEVQVVGYDLEPDPPQPGKPARVLIYYRTLARMYPMYSTALSVGDISGKPWGNYSGFPASFYYPTYRWQAGELYRDAWTINLPADAPNGLYTLDLSWYVYDLETRKPDFDREYKVALGTTRVGDFSVGQIAHAHNARLGGAITFLGWNAQPAPSGNAIFVVRGQSLDLDLFWRADRALQEVYTVFVHLVDASGRVVADADSPPYRGMFPTDRWTIGEIVRDRHMLIIPANLVSGDYSIAIGMYLPSTGERIPIETASNPTDQIFVAQVSVR